MILFSSRIPPSDVRRRPWIVGLLALAALIQPAPARAAVDAGRPACDYCRMIFSEPGFGGEIVTRSGQRRIYDAVECMAAAVLTDSVPQREIQSIRVVDHVAPHERIALGHTVFLHCPAIESPMGLSLLAFAGRDRAERACPKHGGRLLDWRGVLTLVDSTWFQGRLAVGPHVGKLAQPGRPGSSEPH